MRIWTLSLKGNVATERQVKSLAEGLRLELGDAEVQSFFPAPLQSAESLASNTGVTWTDILTPPALNALGLNPPWPDVVVSCRPEVSALALSVKQASGGKTRIIHIQNPNGYSGHYHFHVSAFDLVVRQPQEKFPGDDGENVISSKLALHGLTPEIIGEFRRNSEEVVGRLKLSNPLVVLVGGSDEHVKLDKDHYENLGVELDWLSQMHGGSVVVLTSRRTGREGMDVLKTAASRNKNVVCDNPNIKYTDALALGERFIVTAESLSMVAEALATGKPCSIYDFSGYLRRHPLNKVFVELLKEGMISRYPHWPEKNNVQPYDEIPDLAQTICAKLKLADVHPR